MMTNRYHTVLYTGVTSDLFKRVRQHKDRVHPNSFTARYRLFKLVYYEGFSTIVEAIAREKQIKAGSRGQKERLINKMNPKWKDLFEEVKMW